MTSDGTVNSNEVIAPTDVRAEVEQHVEENLVFRAPFTQVEMTSGTYEVPYMGENGEVAGEISEGNAYPTTDDEQTQSVTLSARKFGTAVEVTDEAIQDSMFDVVRAHTQDKAEALARKLDNVCYNIVSADADANGSPDNLQSTVVGDASGTLDFSDIVDARAALRGESYNADTLIVSPSAEADILQMNQFTHASEAGDERLATGAIGTILGLDVFVDESGNTGAAECYMFDGSKYGYEGVRLDMEAEEYRKDSEDKNVIKVRTRRDWGVAYTKAGVKIDA